MPAKRTTKDTALSFAQFAALCAKSTTEEDIKSVYARFFGITYDTSAKIDLYTPFVLFEFKYDKNLTNIRARAAVIAQMMYYVRRLKRSDAGKPVPPMLCVADKNEAFLSETSVWRRFFQDEQEKYDWDAPASHPDTQLVQDIADSPECRAIHISDMTNESEFSAIADHLRTVLAGQAVFAFAEKKLITEENFEEIYDHWNHIFGESVRNGFKTSRYFVLDIQEGRTVVQRDENKVFFDLGGGEFRAKKIPMKDYDHFWSIYERVRNPETVRGILAKIDRLTDEFHRRFHGEFFTPIAFAKKGLEYLEKTVGKEWWKRGYRLWDMACGTGNLEYHLPAEALTACYLSTLYKEDVEHCTRLFPNAHVFQYDYLNDDVGNLFAGSLPFDATWKLPDQLRKDLNDTSIQWIILINPPFATSQTAGTNNSDSKQGVSQSHIRNIMHERKLGEVSRELFAQFLFRIKHEFQGRETHLGLFSTLKYVNANNDQKLRDTIFRFGFERGFVFSSVSFSGTSRAKQFPVGFLVWNLADTRAIDEQEIVLDVFSTDVEKVAQKRMVVEHRDKFLSRWIDRPPATILFPPLSSAITVKEGGSDVRDRIAEGFLGSLMCAGNDFQHQNNTALLSAPYVSAGALSVTPDNFEQAMVVHSVRRIPKATWLNDRDQFMKPNGVLSREFVADCVVWSLYSGSNHTAALRDVVYQGKTYNIPNHFFPFPVRHISSWHITDSDIRNTLAQAEDRFVAVWLVEHHAELSAEAYAVLESGEAIFRSYFSALRSLMTTKFKIATWDAGWWQVRSVLADANLCETEFKALSVRMNTLKAKILPSLYHYGFIS